MNYSNDLTRWNRAGLSRFEYIDANAANLLEQLRLLMINEFSDSDKPLQWAELESDIAIQETHLEKNQRISNQYNAERRDYAWELLRTFSRSVHVTLEHLNAYANEGFIGTATQWENVRRLVSMLDYYPAPSASAYSNVALMVKADKTGTVEPGWQIKNAPEDGSTPVIFETLEDVDVSSELNTLYPYQWHLNFSLFAMDSSNNLLLFTTDLSEQKLFVGQRGIALVKDEDGKVIHSYAIKITTMTDDTLGLSGFNSEQAYYLYQVSLMFHADFISLPKLQGDKVIQLEQAFNYPIGSVITWFKSVWKHAKVTAVENNRIQLSGNELPDANDELFLMSTAKKQTVEFNEGVEGKYLIVPSENYRQDGKVWSELNGVFSESSKPTQNDKGTLERVNEPEASAKNIYYLLANSLPIARVLSLAISLNILEFNGQNKDLSSNQWLLCLFGTTYHALNIIKIEQQKDFYQVYLDYSNVDALSLLQPVQVVNGLFSTILQASDYNRNQNEIKGSEITLNSIPAALKRGRKIIIQCFERAHQAVISEIKRGEISKISIVPALLNSYLSGETRIFSNVISVGHGETRSEKILGSGRATEDYQYFIFETKNISFVPDAQMNSGVRADIIITIDGRVWQQKATLNYSSSSDPHYVVRMTEEGFLKIIFGNGKKARRLPTGNNNVRINFRVGTGEQGNLAAASLIKAVKPHALIESHIQPLAAAGGNAVENTSSIRQTAAASIMTFERAVSLRDFVSLASNHSSVWQASALRKNIKYALNEVIDVVIVPAGGDLLTQELKLQLNQYLIQAALPGVVINILDYQLITLHLDVTVRVKYDEFDYEVVKIAVIDALENEFSLASRKLGQALYRSEIYKIVESVTGVENSDCIIQPLNVNNANPKLTKRQVLYGQEKSAAKRLIKSIRPTARQIIVVSNSHNVSVNTAPFSE